MFYPHLSFCSPIGFSTESYISKAGAHPIGVQGSTRVASCIIHTRDKQLSLLAYSTNLKKIRVVALSPGANVIKLYTTIIVAVL